MLYRFSPYNNPSYGSHFSQHHSGLTDEEIHIIREYGDNLDSTNVKIYGSFNDDNVKASGSHFILNNETEWLYKKMERIVHSINASNYNYDLSGFYENFYYLKYTAPDEHFNWHLDIGPQTSAPRKLSLVLQLSDPSEYEGGEFDVLICDNEERTHKQKGMITAFPAYKAHCVTPVTSGIRRTLSMFAVGPNFR